MSIDPASQWQAMRSSAKLEDAVAAADNATLIAVREYLHTQEPHGLIWFGIGLIENQMIERFIHAETNHD